MLDYELVRWVAAHAGWPVDQLPDDEECNFVLWNHTAYPMLDAFDDLIIRQTYEFFDLAIKAGFPKPLGRSNHPEL